MPLSKTAFVQQFELHAGIVGRDRAPLATHQDVRRRRRVSDV
jgi:hypothetical protein